MKLLLPFFVVLFLALAGCKSSVSLEPITSVTNPSWNGNKPYEVMVIGFAYNPENRIEFEDRVTAMLRSKGVSARQSYEVYPALQMLTVPVMDAYLASSPDAAILLGHAVAMTRDEKHSGKRSSTTELMAGSNRIDWEVEIGALLESALYVSESPTAVWVDRTRLHVGSDVGASALNTYVTYLSAALKRGEIIQRLKE